MLKRGELVKVGFVIGKFISFGVVIIFFGVGIVVYYIFGFNWCIFFLFLVLIIVMGFIVILFILWNILLKKDVFVVLKWEGILIDFIGVLVVVLIFEFISIEGDVGYFK